MILTTSKLVSNVLSQGMITSGQAGLTTTQILEYANIEQTSLIETIVLASEEFLITTDEKVVPAGRAKHRLPSRAFANSLRHLYWKTPTGTQELSMYTQEDLARLSTLSGNIPVGFIIQGNSLILYPTPKEPGVLVWSYILRPNTLVPELNTRRVVGLVDDYTVTINSMSGTFTVDAEYDFISHRSGNEVIYHDLKVDTIDVNNIKFTTPIPDVEVGNWLCVNAETPVPNLPEELHALLLDMTLLRIQDARGLEAPANKTRARIKDLTRKLTNILSSRVESKPVVFGGNNPFLF